MDFNDIISSFAKRHGVENLVVEDGSAALDIDGIVTTVVCADGTVTVAAEVGEPPAEGRAAFADLLLEANLEQPVFFAKSRDTGLYVVVRRLALSELDDERFDSALDTFVNCVETWRRLLADFRPAAEAASGAAGAEGDIPSFGPSGFMQV